MDLEKYKKLYFDEAEDKISILNSALLGLEKEPTNTVFAEKAMRAAHTLKSSSAAMGYNQIAGLSHAMEDFFEEVRLQKKGLSTNVIQLIFESIDAITDALGRVKNGDDEPSTVNLVDKLKQGNDSTSIASDDELDLKKNFSKRLVNKERIDSRAFEPITSIKVDVKVLDSLMTLTEELLVEKMRLEQIVKTMQDSTNDASADLEVTSKNISRLMSDLQYTVTKTHMVPLGQLFERFPRVVRDLAKEQGKEVSFNVSGQDIELDRTVVDRLGEPLIHIIRNAVDHGVQDKGTIILSAERERDSVQIMVKNSGAPVNWQKIIEVALNRGLIDQVTKDEYIRKIADPKFISQKSKIEALLYTGKISTSDKVTEVSGRGVGLSIVKSVVESFGGRVTIKTDNTGTQFILSIPLTIAIVQALLVRVSNNVFALPFAQVDRLVRVPFLNIKKAFDKEVAVIGEEDIPLIRLKQRFGLDERSNLFLSDKEMQEARQELKAELMVVTKHDRLMNVPSGQIGIIVDEVFSEQDIVVKPLRGILKQTKGFAGVTLLGDGRPALILDVTSML